MKSPWTVSNFLFVVVIFCSVLYFSYIFLMAVFGSYFNAKPSGPDDFYVGVRTLLNVLPWLLLLSVLVTAALVFVLPKSLFFVALTTTLISFVIIFMPLKDNVFDKKTENQFLLLMQTNDNNFKTLVSETVDLDNQGFEAKSLAHKLDNVLLNSRLGASKFITYDSFISIHNYVNQQGIIPVETKYIYVTPLLNNLLFKNISDVDLKKQGFIIKEWNKNFEGVPYLRLGNIKDLREAGIFGLSLLLIYESTNFPTNKFVTTLSLLPDQNMNKDLIYSETENIYFNKILSQSNFDIQKYLQTVGYFVPRESEKDIYLSKNYYRK